MATWDNPEPTNRETWKAAVNATDKILRQTIRDALDQLSEEGFMEWIRGFVGKGEL